MSSTHRPPRRSLVDLPSTSWHWGTAAEISQLVRTTTITAEQAVLNALQRIEQVQPEINCFADVYTDDAILAARTWDLRVAHGDPLPPLVGVPVAIKDDTPVAGKRTAFGSFGWADNVTPNDAVVVRRLREAGAIVVGKTTLSELCSGALTETEICGITRNPWDPDRSPGGSSGGSGAAVASGCVPIAVGSDAGGSVRSPAAFCGVVGLKPSSGRVPFDTMPSIFDGMMHLGPVTASVEDAALFLDATAGPDDADILSLPAPGVGYTPVDPAVDGLRIAVNLDYGYHHVEPDVLLNIDAALEHLREKGAIVETVDLAWSREIEDAWYRWWSVYLAAFLGDEIDARAGRVGAVPHAQVADGRTVTAVEFKRIELLRTRMWHDIAPILVDHDALIVPATGRTAPACGMTDEDFRVDRADGRLAAVSMHLPINFIPQCPAISVPTGFASDGLPTSVQVVGRRYDEPTVLRIAAQLERASDGGVRRPPVRSGRQRRAGRWT